MHHQPATSGAHQDDEQISYEQESPAMRGTSSTKRSGGVGLTIIAAALNLESCDLNRYRPQCSINVQANSTL